MIIKSIQPSRRNLMLQRCAKARNLLDMVQRVKGIDATPAFDEIKRIEQQLRDIPTKLVKSDLL